MESAERDLSEIDCVICLLPAKNGRRQAAVREQLSAISGRSQTTATGQKQPVATPRELGATQSEFNGAAKLGPTDQALYTGLPGW